MNIFDQYLVDYLLNLIMLLFFPDPEPPAINILHELSEIYGHYKLCSLSFSYFIKTRKYKIVFLLSFINEFFEK